MFSNRTKVVIETQFMTNYDISPKIVWLLPSEITYWKQVPISFRGSGIVLNSASETEIVRICWMSCITFRIFLLFLFDPTSVNSLRFFSTKQYNDQELISLCNINRGIDVYLIGKKQSCIHVAFLWGKKFFRQFFWTHFSKTVNFPSVSIGLWKIPNINES